MLLADKPQYSYPLARIAGDNAASATRESLSAQAKSLYRALLAGGGAYHAELPALTAVRPDQVHAALAELWSVGLVTVEDGRVTAVLYHDVVHALLTDQTRRLENALSGVREAQRRLRILLREGPWLSGDNVGTVLPTSADDGEAGQHGYETRTQPRTDMAALHPGARFSEELLNSSLKRAEAELGRGIRLRVVHQTAAMSHPQSAAYLHRLEQLGGQVRLRRDLPFRLILIDGETAVCRLRWQDGLDETMLLQGPRMVGLLGRLFESTWVDSVPLAGVAEGRSEDRAIRTEAERPDPGLPLTDEHRVIMRHLANGATDQSIAHSLGVTTRTVTRRMNEIYQALGVQSRFQAGAVARRMGLI